jgi:tRNA(Ile)-lysidine synthase TilS/MesJ
MGKKRLHNESFFVAKRVGRAVHGFTMLPDGCRAIVALSGGIGSLTMFRAMIHRETWTPTAATYIPVHVPDGVHGAGAEVSAMLQEQVKEWGHKLIVLAAGDASDHYAPIPHAATLLAAAKAHDAQVIVLGQTVLDRAFAVLLPMLASGQLAELPEVDELEGIKISRPLCHTAPEAVLNMARAEQIPILDPAPHPQAALRTTIHEHLAAKKGNLIEQLRNASNAPQNITDEYMA